MKIKRFTAPNLREAMRMVREEQGPDAVILSNRRIEDGFEVVAATDYDAAMLQHAAGRDARPVSDSTFAQTVAVMAPVAASAPIVETLVQNAPPRVAGVPASVLAPRDMSSQSGDKREQERPPFFARLKQKSHASLPVAQPVATPVIAAAAVHADSAAVSVLEPVAAVAVQTLAAPVAAAPVPMMAPVEVDQIKAEMQSMRRFMEQQLALMTRSEPAVRHPIRADVVRLLTDLGVESQLARTIAAEIPEGASAEHARQQALAALARRIPALKHEWLDAGGVVALIGPTGVGKTTSIAKLAARYVQSWGLRDVALITTDHFRIGAQEQLFTYGRLLGVPVLTADNQTELRLALNKLRDCKLVLIDTAGMSPRDANLEKQFAMLSGLSKPIRTALVMSAGSQLGDLDAQFARFSPANPGAVILTKIDEAARLGPAFSALARRDVPLAYVTDGQRVPEDLCAAKPEDLVRNAAESLRRDQSLRISTDAELELDGAAHA